MQADTPNPTRTPTRTGLRARVQAAIQTIDTRYLATQTGFDSAERRRCFRPLLACAARVREPGASGHMRRVGRIAQAVALAAAWHDASAAELRLLGALHDVGKLGVPGTILAKPCPLTEQERKQVRRHTVIGCRLFAGAQSPLLQAAGRVAHQHHEWWDGGGYPRGVLGAETEPAARIVAIADVYDALTSDRPYRARLAHEVAFRLMEEGRATQFAPQLFDAFADAWRAGRCAVR